MLQSFYNESFEDQITLAKYIGLGRKVKQSGNYQTQNTYLFMIQNNYI